MILCDLTPKGEIWVPEVWIHTLSPHYLILNLVTVFPDVAAA